MWDQQNGKFPWKPGTPIFKCRTKECATAGGVIWEPKGGAPIAKINPAKLPAPAHANKPDAELPPLLQNQESEDAAELASKVGTTREDALNELKAKHAFALKHAVEYVLKHVEPLYTEKKIGLTGDEVYKHAYTIFQTWEDKGLIE